MGIKFRFRRTKCTGRYRDKPLVELRWTTEEGDYCLEDLIAGDLGAELAARLPGGNGDQLPPAPAGVPAPHRTVVNVDLTQNSRTNAQAIRRTAIQARPALPDDPDFPPGLLNKIV